MASIYYVTSGYRRPIDMLDHAMIKSLMGRNDRVKYFDLNTMPIQNLIPDIVRFSPDIMITICGPESILPIHIVRAIRGMAIATAVWFTDDPYAIDNALAVVAEYDFVFTIDSGCVPYYESSGCKNVFHLPLGTDPDIFYPHPVHPSYYNDVCFIGTGYQNRLRFFEEVLRRLNGVQVQLVGHYWENLRLTGSCMPHIRKKWINPPEAVKYYNGSKIVLNIHRSQDDPLLDKNKAGAPGHSINNRTFDIAACRAFQLIDYRPDFDQFYQAGAEMIAFESPEECASLINKYLQNSELRMEMARKSYERTIKEHTFSQRVHAMMNIIQKVPDFHK